MLIICICQAWSHFVSMSQRDFSGLQGQVYFKFPFQALNCLKAVTRKTSLAEFLVCFDGYVFECKVFDGK